jgi:hypothetical protein
LPPPCAPTLTCRLFTKLRYYCEIQRTEHPMHCRAQACGGCSSAGDASSYSVLHAYPLFEARNASQVSHLLSEHSDMPLRRHLLGRIQQHQAASLLQALSHPYALQLLARFAQQLLQPSTSGADLQVACSARSAASNVMAAGG